MRKLFPVLAAGLALCAPTTRAAEETAPPMPPPLDPTNLDRNVKPGDDFYHFANGTWLKNNPIPPDQTRWGSFNTLDERNKAALHIILDDCAAAAAKGGEAALKGSNIQKVGDFYASGMDEAAIEAQGFQPLAPFLNEIAAIKDPTALPTLVAGLHSAGVRALFRFEVGADEKDSETDIAQLGQGGLGCRTAIITSSKTKSRKRCAPPTRTTSPRCLSCWATSRGGRRRGQDSAQF